MSKVKARRRKIISLFMKKGLTIEQAVGITASLRGENNTFDPKRKQGNGGPAIGIAQWENDRRSKKGEGRQDALKKRKNWDTLEGQVDHIYDEMTGKVPQRISGFKKEYRDVILQGDSSTIAKNFTKFFEKPGTSLPSNRQEIGDTGFTAHEEHRASKADGIMADFVENRPKAPTILQPEENLEEPEVSSIMNPATRSDDTYTPPKSIMDRTKKSNDTFTLDDSILNSKALQ